MEQRAGGMISWDEAAYFLKFVEGTVVLAGKAVLLSSHGIPKRRWFFWMIWRMLAERGPIDGEMGETTGRYEEKRKKKRVNTDRRKYTRRVLCGCGDHTHRMYLETPLHQRRHLQCVSFSFHWHQTYRARILCCKSALFLTRPCCCSHVRLHRMSDNAEQP